MTKKELKGLVKRSKKGYLYFEKPKRLSKKKRYEITNANWEFFLMESILKINHMEETEYVFANKWGTFCEDFRFNKKFRKASMYNWGDYLADVNGPVFRAKFMTLVLFWMLENSYEVSRKLARSVKNKKTRTKRHLLHQIILRTNLFVVNFLSTADYGETLLSIMDLSFIPHNPSEAKKIIETIQTQKEFLLYGITHKEEYPDAILWDSAMKLSFLLTTGSYQFKNIPKLDYIDFENRAGMKEVIGRLGIAIRIQRATSKKPIPTMYKFYCMAKPYNKTFIDGVNSYPELRTGVQALSYLKFIICNDSFTEWIESIV